MPRLLLTLAVLVLLTPLQTLAQCPDLDPLDDGSGALGAIGLPALVISEVNPGEYIELFNTTASDITLPSVYWLCSSFVYAQSAGTIPAGGYATIPWPANFTHVTDAVGEMMLYDSGLFGTSTDILDYIIWGAPALNRKGQATAVGKWTGANLTALTGGAVHRKIGVKGTGAADYENASCRRPRATPTPTGGPNLRWRARGVWNSPNHQDRHAGGVMLDASAEVEVAIYSVNGALVRVLSKQSFSAGQNRVAWDGTDQSGRSVASGTYLARLSGGVSAATRVTLIR
jgi:hypothetical protein